MRASICALALPLLAACTSIDSFTPAVTGLAAPTGTRDRTPIVLPLRVCNVPTSFLTDPVFGGIQATPVVFDILGSGFMPELSSATSSNDYLRPTVALEGPATYVDPGAGVLDSGSIVFRLEYGKEPLVEGTYTVTVRNPDASERTTARLENAVQIVGPPVAVPTPSHVCTFPGPATALFRGGPFVPGLRVQSSTFNGDLKATIDAPDQVSVEIPANAGGTIPLRFLDPTGCSSEAAIQVTCP